MNKRILFADKNDNAHIKLRFFLQKHGCKVIDVQNATESLFYLKYQKIDIVIIDQSVINKNHNFLSTVIREGQNANFILIKDNDIEMKITPKYQAKVTQFKKGFDPELLVKAIELC